MKEKITIQQCKTMSLTGSSQREGNKLQRLVVQVSSSEQCDYNILVVASSFTSIISWTEAGQNQQKDQRNLTTSRTAGYDSFRGAGVLFEVKMIVSKQRLEEIQGTYDCTG